MKRIITILISVMCLLTQMNVFADTQAENPVEETVTQEAAQNAADNDNENNTVSDTVEDKKEEEKKTVNAITVIVNGEELVSDVEPKIVNDRTMLPMRAIFEILGARVTWVAEHKTIFAVAGPHLMVLQIGNDVMSLQKVSDDTTEVITLDAPPYIYKDRTLVPVRAVAEAMDAKVEWDAETRTVTINQ